MSDKQKEVVKYYDRLGSRLGYDLIMKGSQHFGYYPDSNLKIDEAEAQDNMNDLVGVKLNLQAGEKVLDAGCGQGVVSVHLAKKYDCKIWGITIVPLEVKKAVERAEKNNVADKTNYKLLDYSNTKFPDNYFDAIYTTETLSHSPDVRKTLKELLRVLKPGGRIALFEYTLDDLEKFNPWERKMLDLVIEGSAMHGLYEFKHDRFSEVLKEAGFMDVAEENITKNVRPSWLRLHKIAKTPYKLIRLFYLQKFFINATAGYEWFKFIDKDLYRYCIFTAKKR